MVVSTMLKNLLTIGTILLLSTAGAMAQMKPGGMAAARACKPDIAQFCSTVAPGAAASKRV
jgi:hypothetical protein